MSLREPLLLLPEPFPRIWGGEVWTLTDREGACSRVQGGRHDGKLLGELVRSERADLLGSARASADGRFPLLVKRIETRQVLSVQVHPDDEAARALDRGAQAKTECWYVLDAQSNARLYLGLEPGVDAERMAACAGKAEIVDLLRHWPVEAGQFVFVPAGTVHAIAAGLHLVEIQENSDTTYRLYDWGRGGADGEPRPIHVTEALRSIDYVRRVDGPVAPEPREEAAGVRAALLVDCPAFRVEWLEITGAVERPTRGRPLVYVVLGGRGRLSIAGASTGTSLLALQTWLVPAGAEAHRIESDAGPLHLLCATPGDGAVG